MDQVPARVPDECVIEVFSRERVASIDRRSGRASKIARRTATALDRSRHQSRHAPFGSNDAPWFFRADPINLRRRAIHGNALKAWRHRVEQIASGITIVIHEQSDMVAVVAGEAMPVIVETQSMLATAGLGRHDQSARLDREIPSMKIDRRSWMAQ